KYGFAANWDYIVKKTFVYEGTPLFNQYKLDGVLVKNDMGMPDFRFLDDAVGTLYQFVSSALKDGDENGRNGVFRQICHGTSTNFVYAACLRSLLGQAGNANGRETVMDYERNMSQIRKGLSGHTANWFSELIRLARQGWTDGDAREITETHLSEDAIKEALIGFRYQNQKLKSAARGQKWPQYCADIASRIY
ncbi:MAG: hypothetical protein LBV27_03530, partial [Oscillospiraceae bacterium]|nr:hypothetical protein [Oscillospiraceae bacterium]